MRKSRLGWIALAMLAGCASAGTGSPLSANVAEPPLLPPAAEASPVTAAEWFAAGAKRAEGNRQGPRRARNLILFIGDGMSLTTVAAARILEGQQHGRTGEENRLSFEQFPWTAFSKTYNTDSQTPDSAGTMSAMITGSKTRMGVLSVAPSVTRGDCASAQGADMPTLLEIAEAAGLATGVVTTTRLTHATPAATYAHTPDRNWETDADLPEAARAAGCRDIARQFAEFDVGDGIEVAMGGGRSHFLPAGAEDPEYSEFPGDRLDGRDLVAEWQARRPGSAYVWNEKQLAALDLSHTSRLLGLFEPDHMNYEHDRPKDRAGEPSLAQMTRAALGVLGQHQEGYFLMVEGGRIDHANHAGNAFRALTETIAFSDAIRAAVETASADTLVVVTADHSHTLTFVGYPKRGNPILGKVVGSSGEDAGPGYATDALGLPYTTLSYANGPGYVGATDQQPEGPKHFPAEVSGAQVAHDRPHLADVDTEDPDYLQEATMPARAETHAGDDVGIWARGPGADAVHGALEQNTIFHLLLQAQPKLVSYLCSLGDCDDGVPVRAPAPAQLRTHAAPARAPQAR